MHTDAHCNHSVNLKCNIRMISQKYGCEQHDDGAAFSSLYSIARMILKVSSIDFISLSVESVRTLMKGELTMFNSCSFYVLTARYLRLLTNNRGDRLIPL